MRAAMILVLVAVFVVACRGPEEPRRPVAEGDAERGRALIQSYGCGGCHTIPGVLAARALVGPPLWAMADRGYIGGVLPNTQSDMVRWIRNPPAVKPRTLMPNLGVTESDARDIAAYLSTLRAEPVAVRMVRGFIERAVGRQVPDPRGGAGRSE
jgi:cytochrome c